MLFFLHFGEALAAIYRTVFTGLEGNLCLCSAGCTGGCKHLSLFSGSVFTGVAAGLAALGLFDNNALLKLLGHIILILKGLSAAFKLVFCPANRIVHSLFAHRKTARNGLIGITLEIKLKNLKLSL